MPNPVKYPATIIVEKATELMNATPGKVITPTELQKAVGGGDFTRCEQGLRVARILRGAMFESTADLNTDFAVLLPDQVPTASPAVTLAYATLQEEHGASITKMVCDMSQLLQHVGIHAIRGAEQRELAVTTQAQAEVSAKQEELLRTVAALDRMRHVAKRWRKECRKASVGRQTAEVKARAMQEELQHLRARCEKLDEALDQARSANGTLREQLAARTAKSKVKA